MREGAILRWQIAADRGVESAQNNLAFVLEEGVCVCARARRLETIGIDPLFFVRACVRAVAKNQKRGIQTAAGASDDFNRTAHDALMYWTRSAAQGDIDAMVKLGDLHYSGFGIDEPASLRHEKAAGYYQAAIDSHSAIAMWNVAWMYENGVGAPQVSCGGVAVQTNKPAF
jgi:SEL1 protein